MASHTSMHKSTSDLENHDSGASSGGSSLYPIAPEWMFNTYTVPAGHEISLPITQDTDIYPSSDDSSDYSRLHLVDLAMLQSEQQMSRTSSPGLYLEQQMVRTSPPGLHSRQLMVRTSPPGRGEKFSQPHVQLLQQQERLLRLLEEDIKDQRDSTRRIQEMQQLQGQLLELHTQQISDLHIEFREFRLKADKGHISSSSCSCNSTSSSSVSTSPINYSARSHRGQVPHPYSPAHDSFCSQHPAMRLNHRKSSESCKSSRRPIPADIDSAVQEATRVLQSFFSDGGLGVQKNTHQKDCKKSKRAHDRNNSERQSRMERSASQRQRGERKSRSDTHLAMEDRRPEERRRAQSVGGQRHHESSRKKSVDRSSRDSRSHHSKDRTDRKARHMENTERQHAVKDRRSSKRYGVATSIELDLNSKPKTHQQQEKTVHIEDMAIVEAPVSAEKPSEKKDKKSSKGSSKGIYKKKKSLAKVCSIM